jgi:hypothetical protein
MLKMTKAAILGNFFGLFSTLVYGQCPSCDSPPAIDCRISFDGAFVGLNTFKQFGCRADVIASYGESKVNTCRRTFGSPFLLFDMALVDHSSNNGSRSVSRYASGAKIDYKEQISEAYDQAIELAGKYGDTAAEARLKEMKKRHLEISLQYSTNQDSIELKVEAAGHGWQLDRKRGWQDSSVEAIVACIAPINLFDQVKAHVGLKGDQVSIRNVGRSPLYVQYALAEDAEAKCDTVKPTLTLLLNSLQVETYRIPALNGKPGKICVHYHNKRVASTNPAARLLKSQIFRSLAQISYQAINKLVIWLSACGFIRSE